MLTQTNRVGRPAGTGRPPQKCLCCSRPAKLRGLCMRDYQAARRQVLLQKTTWEYLESAGLALPSRRSHSAEPNPFMAKWAKLANRGAQAGRSQANARQGHSQMWRLGPLGQSIDLQAPQQPTDDPGETFA